MQMETWKVKLYIRKYLILNQHYKSLIKYSVIILKVLFKNYSFH